MDRGSNFINWSHPEKIETKAHFWWTCSKKTSEWHNHLIISYICSYNKYFYVSCQFRLTSCPSLLGFRGAPQCKTNSAKTEKVPNKLTGHPICHQTWSSVRKADEKFGRKVNLCGSHDIWGSVLCSCLVIGSYLRSCLAPMTLRSMK